MAGKAAVARVLCAVALFSFAFLLSPHRVGADGGATITSAGPLTQIQITPDLNCQVAYAGDDSYEFFTDGTTGSCGTFLAVGGELYGPATIPSYSFASYAAWSPVSQSAVAGSGSTNDDPFVVSTVVTAGGTGLSVEEIDSYAVGSRSYKTRVQITNQGQSAVSAILYRAADCYLQNFDFGFGRVDNGAPACVVDPTQGQRIEQWIPGTPGSHYMEGDYGSVYDVLSAQQQFPNTCVCDQAVDNGAGISWAVNVAPGQLVAFEQDTFISPVGGSPVAAQSLVSSVPDPTQITLDPVVVIQSVALTAGVIVLVPFPSALFNNTLEENYAEVMGWLARVSAAASRRWQRFLIWIRTQIASRRPVVAPAPNTPPTPGLAAEPAAENEATAAADPWASPIRIGGFVLLTALLYAFLDPTFGFSVGSLAELAGLAVGLFVVLAAWGVPLVYMSRRDHFPITARALPATLLVGLACVVISRVVNFQPGYLYGLIVGFFIAHGTDKAIAGKAKAVAAGTTLVVALIAWVALIFLRGPAGSGDLGAILVQTAAVTVVVTGVENAVFAMLPLRFMPGQDVFNWDRRVWAVLMALGLFGFVHVLLNPAAGSGYLADSTRTSFFTMVALLAFFGIASVLFWAYFRFRPKRSEPGHPPAATPAE